MDIEGDWDRIKSSGAIDLNVYTALALEHVPMQPGRSRWEPQAVSDLEHHVRRYGVADLEFVEREFSLKRAVPLSLGSMEYTLRVLTELTHQPPTIVFDTALRHFCMRYDIYFDGPGQRPRIFDEETERWQLIAPHNTVTDLFTRKPIV